MATALKNTPGAPPARGRGDFTAVAVVRYAPPKPGEVPPTGHLGAGLAAWVDDEFYAMVNRHHWPTGGAGWNGGFDTHSKAPGGGVVSHGAVGEGIAPADAGHLRIVRRGNELETFYSTDGGENWVSTGKVEGTWPGNLAVGVSSGFNTTKLDAEAVFDSLTVTK